MNTKIKIVGVGEGGAKTISKLIQSGVGKDKFVEFIAIGNDENIMLTSAARKNIFLNRDLTIIYKSIFDAPGDIVLIIQYHNEFAVALSRGLCVVPCEQYIPHT